MSHSVEERKCPDCSAALVAIKLVGRLRSQVGDSEVMYYADKDAKRSVWSARFQEAGIVQTTMCSGCRRIFLHGAPTRSP
jgi:hypothetical protein